MGFIRVSRMWEDIVNTDKWIGSSTNFNRVGSQYCLWHYCYIYICRMKDLEHSAATFGSLEVISLYDQNCTVNSWPHVVPAELIYLSKAANPANGSSLGHHFVWAIMHSTLAYKGLRQSLIIQWCRRRVAWDLIQFQDHRITLSRAYQLASDKL